MDTANSAAPAVMPATEPVATITLKLPAFWVKDPLLWFLQVEGQFSVRSIKAQRTRFDHVIACLDPEIAAEVRDLLLNPPADNPYDALKTALIARLTDSQSHRVQQLLNHTDLGDCRPSQLLRHMQQLLGTNTASDDVILRQLFLQQLPPAVCLSLANVVAPSINDLTAAADAAMDVHRSLPPDAAIAPAPVSAPDNHSQSAAHQTQPPYDNCRFPGGHSQPAQQHPTTALNRVFSTNLVSAGTTPVSEKTPGPALHLAPSREKLPETSDGDARLSRTAMSPLPD